MTSTNEKLDQLLRVMERIAVPIPAIPAIPAIPQIPQIPAIPALVQYTADHDLLVEINTEVKGLKESFKKLTEKEDTHVTQYEFNERKKATDTLFTDHEERIRGNEVSITRIMTFGSAIIVITTIAQFVINLLK